MKYYKKKYYKLVWSKFKLLILLYLAFVIAWLIIDFYFVHFDHNLFLNWFSSFSEDLLFFGTGLTGIILGAKLPRDENFNTRVSSLANGEFADKDAEYFLYKEVQRLMTFNKDHHINMTIKKLSSNKEYIYVHVDSNCLIVNMCEDEAIPFSIRTSVVPGKPVDGTHGLVSYHTVTFEPDKHKVHPNLAPINFIEVGHNVLLDELPNFRYSLNRQINIYGNEQARLKLCYEIWLPLDKDKTNVFDNWYFNNFTNYTEKFTLEIHNELKGADIKINYKYPDRRVMDNSAVIDSDGTISARRKEIVVKDLKFQKNDKFEIYFYKN